MITHEEFKEELEVVDKEIMFRDLRLIFCPADWLTGQEEEISNILGSNALSMLFQKAGEFCHDELAKIIVDSNPDASTEEQIKAFLSYLNASGWGAAELVEFSLDPVTVVIKVKNSYVVDLMQADEPVCYAYGGILQTITVFLEEHNLESELECTETKCVAKGDPHCEFRLKSLV
jgi:predicted hydrocarbon binding protein